jgi:ABC-2 type transport system ATP-binding protein
VANLIQPVKDKHVVQLAVSNVDPPLLDNLAKAFPNLSFNAFAQKLIRVEAKESVHVGPLVRLLEDQGIQVTEARRMRHSLEDVFVHITGIEADTMRKEKEKAGGGGA